MADLNINVVGSDPVDALSLAIWAAFDSERERNGVSFDLKFDARLGKELARSVLDNLLEENVVAGKRRKASNRP